MDNFIQGMTRSEVTRDGSSVTAKPNDELVFSINTQQSDEEQ